MANSKTKSNYHEAEAAPAADAMTEFQRLRGILAETHDAIPRLLQRQREVDRRLGDSDSEELRRELEQVVAERQHAARRRAAGIAAILELEPALQAERAAVERDRQGYAVAASAALRARYDSVVAQLQALWEEGRLLGAALRCEVLLPLPVKLKASPIDGTVKALPLPSNSEVALTDAKAAELGAKLDRVDQALAACHAIRQAREWDARHHRLATIRGTPTEFVGTYRVLLTFQCPTDGLEFAPNELVDASLLGPGMMHRLQVAKRYVEPVELGPAAGAAA